MHERHADELPLRASQISLPIPPDKFASDGPSFSVPRECLRAVPVKVARYLVEQKDGSEGSAAIRSERFGESSAKLPQGCRKSSMQHLVQGVGPAEPVCLAQLVKPDIEKVRCPRADRGQHDRLAFCVAIDPAIGDEILKKHNAAEKSAVSIERRHVVQAT